MNKKRSISFNFICFVIFLILVTSLYSCKGENETVTTRHEQDEPKSLKKAADDAVHPKKQINSEELTAEIEQEMPVESEVNTKESEQIPEEKRIEEAVNDLLVISKEPPRADQITDVSEKQEQVILETNIKEKKIVKEQQKGKVAISEKVMKPLSQLNISEGSEKNAETFVEDGSYLKETKTGDVKKENQIASDLAVENVHAVTGEKALLLDKKAAVVELEKKKIVTNVKEVKPGSGSVNGFLTLDGLVLAATDNGVFISENNGDSWVQKVTPMHRVQGKEVPLKINTIFKKGELVYIGGEGGVWFSKNPQIEWRKHSTGLDEKIIVYSINYDDTNNLLLIGTNDGVFNRTTWGSWNQMNGKNLPYNTIVKNIVKYESLDGEKLAIGTHANGIWFWENGDWRQFSTWITLSKIKQMGLDDNLANVNALHFERMTNTLWAASTTGVNWKGVNFEGTWEELEFRKNFFSSHVIASSPDNAQLYIGTSNGMFYVRLEEFNGLVKVDNIETHLVEGTLGKDITAITVLSGGSILYSSDKGIEKVALNTIR